VSGAAELKVFLCGEGANELGSRARERAYQTDDQPGVIQALLRKVRSDGWRVGGAVTWKNIRKFRAGGAAHADTTNVRGAALDAREMKCDVLAFVRDGDGDAWRSRAIDEGIELAERDGGRALAIVGGVAVPAIEGWILALRGEARTEERSRGQLGARLGADAKSTDAYVAAAEAADLSALPGDARSLRAWVGRAEAALLARSGA
jgi:hypothetical protein